jgi:hypothetical protein
MLSEQIFGPPFMNVREGVEDRLILGVFRLQNKLAKTILGRLHYSTCDCGPMEVTPFFPRRWNQRTHEQGFCAADNRDQVGHFTDLVAACSGERRTTEENAVQLAESFDALLVGGNVL